MQTKNAIGNLINRYRAVLKKCNLLNTFGTLAIASAIAMSGAGMASAVTFSGDINLSGIEGEADPSTQAGAYQINNGEWVSDEPGVSVSQQDKNDNPVFSEGDGNYGIYLNGAAEKADITLNGANFNVKTNNHAGYGARVGFTGGTIKVVEGTTNTIGQMLTVDGQNIILKAVTADGKDSAASADKGDLVVTGYLTTTVGATADLSGADIFIKSGPVGVEGEEQTGAMIHGVSDGITVGNLTFEEGTALAVFGDRTTSGDNDRALAIKNGTVTFKDGTFIGGSAENGMTKNTLTLEKAAGADFANVVVTDGASFKIGRATTLDGVTFTNNGNVDLAADLNVNDGSVFQNGAVTVGKADQEAALAVGINVAQGAQFNVDSLTVAGADGQLTTLTVDNKHKTQDGVGNIEGMGVNAYVGQLNVQNNGIVNIDDTSYTSGSMNVSLAVGDFAIAEKGQINVLQGGTFEVHGDNGKYELGDIIANNATNGKLSIADGGRFKAENVTYNGTTGSIATAGKLDFNSFNAGEKDFTLSGGAVLSVETALTGTKVTLDGSTLELNGEGNGTVDAALVAGGTSAGTITVEEGNWTANSVAFAGTGSALNVKAGSLKLEQETFTVGASDTVQIAGFGNGQDATLTVNGLTLNKASAITVNGDGRLNIEGAINSTQDGSVDLKEYGVASVDWSQNSNADTGIINTNAEDVFTAELGSVIEVKNFDSSKFEDLSAVKTELQKLENATTNAQYKGIDLSSVAENGKADLTDISGFHAAEITATAEASGNAVTGTNTTVKNLEITKATDDVTVTSDGLGLVGDGGSLITAVKEDGTQVKTNVEVADGKNFVIGDITNTNGTTGVLNGSISDTNAGTSGASVAVAHGTFDVMGDVTLNANAASALNLMASTLNVYGDVDVKKLSLNGGTLVAKATADTASKTRDITYNGGVVTIDTIGGEDTNGSVLADKYVTVTGAATILDETAFAITANGLALDSGKAIDLQNTVLVGKNAQFGLTAVKGDINFGNTATVNEGGLLQAVAKDGNITLTGNLTATNGQVQLFAEEGTITAAQVTATDGIFQANNFNATGTTTLDGGTMIALGKKADEKDPAVINTFAQFDAKNGAQVSLGGETKFTGAVTVGTATDTKDSQVYIAKLADQQSAITFTAAGNIAEDADSNGFIQIADLGTQTTALTFTTADNGLISLGSMDLQTMKEQIGMADEAAKTFTNNKDFQYASAIAVSGKGIDLTKANIQAGSGGSKALDIQANNLLIADVSGLKDLAKDAVMTDAGAADNISIADNAGVHLANAVAGKDYILVDGTSSALANNDKIIKSTDNILVKFDTLAIENGDLVASTALNDAKNVFTQMDGSLANLLNTAAATNHNNAFLKLALNQAANGMTAEQISTAVEGAAKAPMVVGAPQTAVSVATMGADYAMARTSFAPRVAGAAAVAENGEYTNISAGDNMANGMNLWIMPMYQNTKADGFKSGSYQMAYDSDFFGVALGGDYTWDNSFRLGATVNMGTGSAESTGSFAKTENDYDSVGVGIYAGYMLGNLGLSADVNYTNISNDITQSSSVMQLSADGDTNVWSIGARAEYKIATEMMDIVPHIGLRYSNISMDAMNFSGVLTTDADNANIWQLPIGVSFSKDFATENGWNVKPSLDLAVIPAFGDTDMAQTVQFAGVSGIASMESEIMDSVSGRAQLGVEVSKDQFYFGLDYAYQGSSDMDTHGVQANIGFKF